jgi:hypothetical protein
MERLDGTVRRALRGAGVPDAGVLAEVTRVWPAAVGDAVARSAWPQRVGRDGTLHVTCVSSTWAFELGRMEDEIRARLAEHLDAPETPPLRFAPGPVPSPGAAERPPYALPAPEPEEERWAASVSEPIDDPELREAVRRAAVASLAAARDDRGV